MSFGFFRGRSLKTNAAEAYLSKRAESCLEFLIRRIVPSGHHFYVGVLPIKRGECDYIPHEGIVYLIVLKSNRQRTAEGVRTILQMPDPKRTDLQPSDGK